MVTESHLLTHAERLTSSDYLRQYLVALTASYTFSTEPDFEKTDHDATEIYPTFPLAPFLPSVILGELAPEIIQGEVREGLQILVENVLVGGALGEPSAGVDIPRIQHGESIHGLQYFTPDSGSVNILEGNHVLAGFLDGLSIHRPDLYTKGYIPVLQHDNPSEPWLLAEGQRGHMWHQLTGEKIPYPGRILQLWTKDAYNITLAMSHIGDTTTLNAFARPNNIRVLIDAICDEQRLSFVHRETLRGKRVRPIKLYSSFPGYSNPYDYMPEGDDFTSDKASITPIEIYRIDTKDGSYVLFKFPISFDAMGGSWGQAIPRFDSPRPFMNMHFVLSLIPRDRAAQCSKAIENLCDQLRFSESHPPMPVWWTIFLNSLFYNRSQPPYLTGSAHIIYPGDIPYHRTVTVPTGFRLEETMDTEALLASIAALDPGNRMIANYIGWHKALSLQDKELICSHVITPWIKALNKAQEPYNPSSHTSELESPAPITREEIVAFAERKETIRTILREVFMGFVHRKTAQYYVRHLDDYVVKEQIMPKDFARVLESFTDEMFPSQGNIQIKHQSVFFRGLFSDMHNLCVVFLGREGTGVLRDVMSDFFEHTIVPQVSTFIQNSQGIPSSDLLMRVQELKKALFLTLVNNVVDRVRDRRPDLQRQSMDKLIFDLRRYLLQRRVTVAHAQHNRKVGQ